MSKVIITCAVTGAIHTPSMSPWLPVTPDEIAGQAIEAAEAGAVILHMRRTADRLFGNDYRWSVLGAGRNQMQVATIAAAMGGNVRVGLEDSLWIAPKQPARSNAEQVRKVRRILEGLSLDIATPDEAREMLSLKGGDRVNF